MKTGILLSGGMDSISLAYWKKPDIAFTIDYGQVSAKGEIRAASHFASLLNMPHEIIRIDCSSLGSGDLANTAPNEFAPISEWWPYRNQLLITLSAMRSISIGVDKLLFGSIKQDSVHVDGRKEFFSSINRLVMMQEGGLRVYAPAIMLSSVELIKNSKIDLSLLAWAHSCHVSEYACGNCRGCFKHRYVMEKLGYGNY